LVGGWADAKEGADVDDVHLVSSASDGGGAHRT
jgi:hypothetical protein